MNFAKKGYNSGSSRKKSNEEHASRKSLSTTKDDHHTDNDDTIDIIISGMNRCYIEDFIETNVGEHVIILFEKSEQNSFPQIHDFIRKTKPHLEYGYMGKLTYIRRIVSSSPNRQLAITGIFLSDLQSGFHN